MTPKEKARKLIKDFETTIRPLDNFDSRREYAIMCVKIHVKEILLLFSNNKFDSRYEYYLEVQNNL